MNIKTIIGLEIHVQLKTKTKAFCGCKNEYGNEPNTTVCPICLGLPGALPVMNKEAVNSAIMAGLAFNCNINEVSSMDRKKYLYPDLTKGYQLSQYEVPICSDGQIEIEDESGNKKNIGLYRIQLEEDTAKSIHNSDNTAFLDFNRCGVPLIEIVSAPDMTSGFEARAFLEKLKNTLVHLDISDCKMEEGSLRCDVNVNIKDMDTGAKTNVIEIKNLNSFRAVERAINFEVERQKVILEAGKTEPKATRRWNDEVNETILMREKYTQEDYRFSPDGDVPNIHVTQELINSINDSMPELVEEKSARFVDTYKITKYDADVIASDKNLSNYFEEATKLVKNYKLVTNFLINEMLRRMKDEDSDYDSLRFTKEQLAKLLEFVDKDEINNNTAKRVFREMFENGVDPSEYIKENSLIQISDEGEIVKIVEDILAANAESVESYLAGKDRALGFLIGQVMKLSKGKANPAKVNELILERLNKSK